MLVLSPKPQFYLKKYTRNFQSQATIKNKHGLEILSHHEVKIHGQNGRSTSLFHVHLAVVCIGSIINLH